MAYRREDRGREYEMKCPNCSKSSLREVQRVVTCSLCGYQLTPGQSDKYRLFQLLKKEQEKDNKPSK